MDFELKRMQEAQLELNHLQDTYIKFNTERQTLQREMDGEIERIKNRYASKITANEREIRRVEDQIRQAKITVMNTTRTYENIQKKLTSSTYSKPGSQRPGGAMGLKY